MDSKFAKNILLFLSSLGLVAFGQPAWNPWTGLIAACVGYALFWQILLDIPTRSRRFWLATIWFTSVQLIQLSWALSHPYAYIYFVHFIVSLLMGMQFGLLGIWITRMTLKSVKKLLALASFWTFMEWIRLYALSGLSWNPVGLALTSQLYPLQMASLWGVFGLSFWVMLVNLTSLKAWNTSPRFAGVWLIAAAVPYLYGFTHFEWHHYAMQEQSSKDHADPFYAVLVQTAFPAEETLDLSDRKQLLDYVLAEWRKILQITKKQLGTSVNLIVLPEMVVPYGTYSFVYAYEEVVQIFKEVYGEQAIKALPIAEEGALVTCCYTPQGKRCFVNNAFWTQGIANIFQAHLVIGLEDAEEFADGKREYYSSALYFSPQQELTRTAYPPIERYEKRVLVPMGEYIPFSFAKALAAQYGIYSSFTPGKGAKVVGDKLPMGLSICYEETFGDLMRENKQCGAQLLVNLTSDVWYPNSRLPQQHFDHARLRTVENGIPLIRACNTGVTAALDSLGQQVAYLGEGEENAEWIADSIRVQVPKYTYKTLYSQVGDLLILGICCFFSLFWLVDYRTRIAKK